MFKPAHFLVLLLLLSFCTFAQNTFVPDDNFEQALIDLGYDTPPLDDFVPTVNISNVTNLDISNKNIADLSGIEDFLNLSILISNDNQLSDIDITNNSNLTQLFVEHNQISSLNVTNNVLLQILWCFENELTNLDVTQNVNLISLRCESNRLTNLNLSQNVNLNVLTCENNSLSMLDISSNTTLNRLQCSNNLLSALDVTNNTDISYLACFSNEISSLNLTNNSDLVTLICFENNLTALDLSQNSSLAILDCSDNNLCSLNLKNGNNTNISDLDFSVNPNLNCVVVDNPNADFSDWIPADFSNFVNSPEACKETVPVDALPDVFKTNNYVLPVITNGNYYSEPNGNGISYTAGDSIITSQTIYIFNSNSCFSNESSFNVIVSDNEYIIPKFFTPNNDSFNDTWKVIDYSGSFISISVYNRFGKLLKSLPLNNFEWDGTFNGKQMETDDYWYVISRDLEKPITGHFTLKR